jgi:catechol-2,3-dioxygenase
MAVQVIKLGFLGLNVVKRDEMQRHYQDVLGLPLSTEAGGDLYFACGGEHHALSLHRDGPAGFRHVGFQIAGPLDGALAQLRAQGVAASLNSDLFPGIGSTIEIADADGYAIYLYCEAAPAKVRYGSAGIRPDKIGHVALRVKSAPDTTKFYTDVLGFRWSDWLEDFFVFLRCNCDHHSMNFLTSPRRGLFHVAFEMRDFAAIGRGVDVLAAHRIPLIWGPGRHGMGHNLFAYHRDPDGNVVEIIADLDRMADERLGYFDPRPYHEDNPQRPKVWKRDPAAANKWGILPPPDFES